MEILLEADYNNIKKTSIVFSKIYPYVSSYMDKNANKLKRCISKYIDSNHTQLYANAPYYRLMYSAANAKDYWDAMGFTEKDIDKLLQECFFYNIPYNPRAAKDPLTVALMMCIRYYIKKGDKKSADMIAIYTSFTPKFYPSIHSNLWKFLPNKNAMEYAVNFNMTDKFTIRQYETIFNSIQNISSIWVNTYTNKFKDDKLDDDEFGTLIQQLHDREKSFLLNIAKVYYSTYESEEYMNYTRDDYDSNNFNVRDNNLSIKAKVINKALSLMSTTDVDYRYCGMVCDQNVKKDEVKEIIESIFHNKDNFNIIREACDIIISDYTKNYPKDKLDSLKFLTYSMSVKPNTKDKYQIRLKEIILHLLSENSAAYLKRKNRKATGISYYKIVLKMIVLYINKAIRQV